MIQFHNLSVTLHNKRILESVSFSLKPHQLTVLLGRNGSGKSTLISCLTQALPYTGEIINDDCPLKMMNSKERAQLLCVLPQSLPPVALNVYELVSLGRSPYLDIGKHFTQKDQRFVEEAMDSLDVRHLASQRVDTLSGGERQKVYLAMVLAQNTRYIILDEPTTYMDIDNEYDFLQTLQALKKTHKKTLLVVMHNLTRACDIADQIVILDQGHCVFSGSKEQCIESGLIEDTFGVTKSSYEINGVKKVLFTK